MTGSGTWPYPGDSPLVRARRTALAYREALREVAPERCASMDAIVERWGQRWAVSTLARHDPSDWVGAAEAAELASVSLATVRWWRKCERLVGRKRGSRWEYQVQAVTAMSANTRTRQRGTTV